MPAGGEDGLIYVQAKSEQNLDINEAMLQTGLVEKIISHLTVPCEPVFGKTGSYGQRRANEKSATLENNEYENFQSENYGSGMRGNARERGRPRGTRSSFHGARGSASNGNFSSQGFYDRFAQQLQQPTSPRNFETKSGFDSKPKRVVSSSRFLLFVNTIYCYYIFYLVKSIIFEIFY